VITGAWPNGAPGHVSERETNNDEKEREMSSPRACLIVEEELVKARDEDIGGGEFDDIAKPVRAPKLRANASGSGSEGFQTLARGLTGLGRVGRRYATVGCLGPMRRTTRSEIPASIGEGNGLSTFKKLPHMRRMGLRGERGSGAAQLRTAAVLTKVDKMRARR
jgi:hypothetical protein